MDKLEKSQMCSILGSLSLPYRQGPVPFPPVHLSLGNWIPAEVELPVKPPVSHVRPSHVFKCVIADHIDDWAHNSFPVRKKNGFKTKLFFLNIPWFYVEAPVHKSRFTTVPASLPQMRLCKLHIFCGQQLFGDVDSCCAPKS